MIPKINFDKKTEGRITDRERKKIIEKYRELLQLSEDFTKKKELELIRKAFDVALDASEVKRSPSGEPPPGPRGAPRRRGDAAQALPAPPEPRRERAGHRRAQEAPRLRRHLFDRPRKRRKQSAAALADHGLFPTGDLS